MTTTLISVIGKPFKGFYDHAVYALNGVQYETDFFFIPLLEHYQPDQFFLLGTKDSIWEQVEKAKQKASFEYQEVVIPFGINETEIWQIFETIVNLPLRDTKVIIDITHGFRAIPLAVFMAVLYFQTARKDVIVRDVLYGNFEARDKTTGIAPVVHLNSLLEMNEWIRAARRFVYYGDGDLLLSKLKPFSQSHEMDAFYQAFENLVNTLQLNFVTQVAPAARKVQQKLNRPVRRQLNLIPPLRLLSNLIKQRLEMFTRDEPEWRQQWRLAEWFFRNRQYSQSLIVLRETLFTFTTLLIGGKTRSREDREEKAGKLHFILATEENTTELQKSFRQEQIEKIHQMLNKIRKMLGDSLYETWRALINDIQKARNRVGHALTVGKGKDEIVDPTEQIQKLQEWIQTSVQVLERIHQINNESGERLRNILRKILKVTTFQNNRVFIIINEGIHPIVDDLKKQFGDDILFEVVTRGNVEIEEEKNIVKKVQEIVLKYRGSEFVIVPSGMPYLITLVYNTLYQITSKHPIYLQYDRDAGQYREKLLDPRKLLF